MGFLLKRYSLRKRHLLSSAFTLQIATDTFKQNDSSYPKQDSIHFLAYSRPNAGFIQSKCRFHLRRMKVAFAPNEDSSVFSLAVDGKLPVFFIERLLHVVDINRKNHYTVTAFEKPETAEHALLYFEICQASASRNCEGLDTYMNHTMC